MTKRQRIVLAASSLAVGGGVVLMAVTGTAGAGPKPTPSRPVVSTVSVAPGQRGLDTAGPKPTATVWATPGPATGTTPTAGVGSGSGDTSSDAVPTVTVAVTPGQTIPADDRKAPTATVRATG